MMRLICVLLCCVVAASGGWLRDLISPKGWHLGGGLVLHLLDSQLPNATFLERHTIVMDYAGYGVGLTKRPRRRAVEVALYADSGEARGDKSSAVNIIIGYKLASAVALVLAGVGAFVLKALTLAKIAIVASSILLLGKFFHAKEQPHHQTPAYVELEPAPELHSDLLEYPPPGAEYHPTGSSGYYSYADFTPGVEYASPEPPGGNSSLPGDQQVAGGGVARRRDVSKRRKVPLLTIHHHSIGS